MNNSIETTVKHYHSKMNKRFQRSSSFSNWSAKLLPILTTTTIDNQKQNNKTFGINRNHRCMTLANGYNGKKYRSSSSSILTVSILIAVFILIWSSNMMTDTVYAVNVGGGGENESIGRNTNPLDDDDNNNRSLQEWEEIFHSRSADDWRNLWHHERHRRCRHDLVAHMEFVCDKDIYKLNRRRKKRSNLNNVNEIYRKSNNGKMENDDLQQQQQNRQYLTFKQANTFAQKQLKRFLRKNHYYSNNNNNDMAVMDIYKNNNIIKKLSGDLNSDNNNNNNNNNMDDFDHLGNGLIAVRRRQQQRQRNKRGISDECCHGQDGCSWEEYAEYCPANVRLRS
uniref:Uncharacterized protein DDB_G0292186-like n=1 Tax=Dermatophagoides pteronyssinus TaxID=6956 RepID=A0A6P6Y6D8_DERPT|nr:uncharacterized protein DDB_G0292186-like [Dermatophagoides pteronyssinus]